MKIVVLDGYTLNPGDLGWDRISALGELVVYDRTSHQDRIAHIGDAEIIFTNKVVIDKEVFIACPSIKFICVLATGYNVVDVQTATEKGIIVANIPTYGTRAVAQSAIALLLEICHHVGAHSSSVLQGDWARSADWCYWKYPLIELYGKTLGIIGFGRIGQQVGEIAKALGMKILAYSKEEALLSQSDQLKYVSLEELFTESDVISLHCPLFEDTRGIINQKTIAKMKNGVIIINTSRGPLVAENDLADALNSGKVYAAGLDVVSTEPIQADNPLLTAKNCIITPHIAWAPKESRQRLMNIAVDNLEQFLLGKPINVVR